MEKEKRCHDCDCKEGEIHSLGCDMEVCSWCGGQLISCSCVYKKLHINCSPGTWAYENGLTKEQEEEWLKLLEKKGRIPYIRYPVICTYCGKLWPEMFKVPDKEWNRYIEPFKRSEVICRECYDHIKSLIEGAKKNENGNNRV
jgi:hypothetical protein